MIGLDSLGQPKQLNRRYSHLLIRMSKTCTKCDIEKPLSEFGKHKDTKDGKTVWCLQCKREHSAKHRNTPAGIYQQIKGQIKFTKRHKGERDNRGYIRGVRKDLLCTQDEFIEWYESQPKICAYCEVSEDELNSVDDVWNRRLTRLSVDAIDNDKGYSIGNMVLSCGRCNATKSDFFTHDEMLEIGKIIRKHWDKCQK